MTNPKDAHMLPEEIKTFVVYNRNDFKIVRVVECTKLMVTMSGMWSNQWDFVEDKELISTSLTARPLAEEIQLIEPLSLAIGEMKANPEKFKKYDAPNGWGTYEHFMPWLEDYLQACKDNPESDVRVSR